MGSDSTRAWLSAAEGVGFEPTVGLHLLRFSRPSTIAPEPLKNKPNSSDQRSLAPSVIHDSCQTDPDLAAVIDAWDRLPEAIRAGIMAMVKAASGK